MKFAILGNPNCGKTTLFNGLTGSRAHVGNWPGVTVEKRTGMCKKGGVEAEIIDLPGIYSLSPYSPEEAVARDFILEGGPDAVINIVDASNIERNLYLTSQILEADIPVVVALNMADIALKNKVRIDARKLSEKLGVPVVEICALRGEGLEELAKAAARVAKTRREGRSPLESSDLGPAIAALAKIAASEGRKNPVMFAVKLLEEGVKGAAMGEFARKQALAEISSVPPSKDFGDDFEARIANARYEKIAGLLEGAVKRGRSGGAPTFSDRVDAVLTSRLFGLPIFFAAMLFVFNFTFGENFLFLASLGLAEEPLLSPGVRLLEYTGELMDAVSGWAAGALEAAAAPEWASALIVDGVLAGVGAVMSFLPQILLLFLFLSIMEDSGYMARAAFLMDKILRRFGLSGKAFMPLLMCFGCLVPAIMGSRTLENERERRLMIMLAPFFSCGAKLPIWAMFSMAIFPSHADLAVFGIYMIGIVTAIAAAVILKKTILKGDAAPFIMELPPYHMPLARNLLLNLWEKLRYFVTRATTIIAGATVVIWFLSSFSFSLEMVEANGKESILGALGSLLTPVFEPLGWASGPDGWKAVVAALTGLIAKEMVVSTMGVLYNPGVDGDALEDDAAGAALAVTLAAAFSPVAAVSYMAFNLLSVPCMAAVATAHAEMRSTRWTWITVAFWIATAWIVSFIIYRIGRPIFG